jgi:hypothetical protein
MQSLIGPFGDEAVAGLIGAAISAMVAIGLYHRSRSKPKHIVCTELLRTSLIQVRQEAGEKTRISYNDVDVERLSLVKLQLRNSGTEEICEPQIKIRVKGPKRIVDVLAEISPERSAPPMKVKFAGESANEIELHLDYINAYSHHKEVFNLDLIVDGKVESLDVLGSGAGWSVQLRSLKSQTIFAISMWTVVIMLAFAFFTLGLAITIIGFTERWNSPTFASPTFRIVLGLILFGLIIGFFMAGVLASILDQIRSSSAKLREIKH